MSFFLLLILLLFCAAIRWSAGWVPPTSGSWDAHVGGFSWRRDEPLGLESFLIHYHQILHRKTKTSINYHACTYIIKIHPKSNILSCFAIIPEIICCVVVWLFFGHCPRWSKRIYDFMNLNKTKVTQFIQYKFYVKGICYLRHCR